MIQEALTSTPLIDPQNPWLGLPAYEEAHRQYFSGREQEETALLRLVRSSRLTVLFGRSGFGKTSLLRAGLFPRLRNEPVFPIYVALDRWDLRQKLSSLIREQIEDAARITSPIHFPQLQEEETLWEALHRSDGQFWNEQNLPVLPLLVFDQFEVVFLRGRNSSTEIEAFLSELADLIEGRPPATLERRLEDRPDDVTRYLFHRHPYKILLSLREDFLPDLEALRPQIPSIIHNRFRLRPLSGEQALRVILKPGRHLLEKGHEELIAERVVRFVAKTEQTEEDTPLVDLEVEPALLSLFCRELNKTRQSKKLNRINGNLLKAHQEEILQYFYERSLEALDPKVRAEVQIFIEDELVTDAGFRTSVTERDAETALGVEVTREALEILVDQRLLRVEDRPGVKRYELIHDVLTTVVRKSREERQLREEFLREQTRWREKLRRARMALLGLFVAALLLFTGLSAGWILWGKAKRAEATARKALIQAGHAEKQARNTLANADFREGLELLQEDLEDPEDQKNRRTDELAHLARATRLSPEETPAGSLILDRLLRHGWHLPLTVLSHERGLNTAQFSPDALRIVTASDDGKARLWEAKTGEIIGQPMEHRKLVLSATFSADGRYIATASADKTAREWDAKTGKLLRTMEHNDVVYSAQYKGEMILTASKDGTARIWGTRRNPKELYRLSHGGAAVQTAFFNHDGKLVVTASWDGTAAIWNAQTGDRLRSLPHKDRVFFAQFSPDDRQVVTASADGSARLWDTRTGRLVATMAHRKNERVRTARFSPDGTRVVTASWDGTARVWSSRDGVPVTPWLRHAARVESADFSPDGHYVATASEDRTVRIWSTESGLQVGEPLRHGDWVYSVQFSPKDSDLRILTASQDGTARVWEVRAGRASEIPLHHSDEVHLAVFNHRGDQVLTAEGRIAHIWNVETGKPVSDPLQHGSWIQSVRFARDDQRLVTAAGDNVVRLWDARSGKKIGIDMQHGVKIRDLQWTGKDQLVTAGEDGKIRTCDAESGQCVVDLDSEARSIKLAAFDPSGTRVAFASGSTLHLWDLIHRRQLGLPRTNEGFHVTWIDFQSDGQRLAAAYTDGMVRIWDINQHEPVFEKPNKGRKVERVQFSPDGKFLAVVSGPEVRMYDAERGKLLHERISHGKGNNILWIAFSDSRRLATAALDGTVRLWDARTGEPIAQPFRHHKEVRTVEFSPDGQRMVTSSADHTARLWEVPTWRGSTEDALQLASLAELACGNRLNESNELEPVPDPQTRRGALRQFENQHGFSPLVSFLRWFLASPWKRTLSPHTQVTAEEYIQRQLATGSPEDRKEAIEAFPDYPRRMN